MSTSEQQWQDDEERDRLEEQGDRREGDEDQPATYEDGTPQEPGEEEQ